MPAKASAVLVALTEAAADEGTPAPRADDLFAYAELLGEQADLLAARDPLPGVTEIKQALRDVMIKLTLGDADTAGHLPGSPTPTWCCSPPPRRRRPRRPPVSSCIPATCRPNAP